MPRLIELRDIKGDLQTHSTWSDGSFTIEQMAEAARARGLKYLAITDHSQGLGIARGDIVQHAWCDNGPTWRSVMLRSSS